MKKSLQILGILVLLGFVVSKIVGYMEKSEADSTDIATANAYWQEQYKQYFKPKMQARLVSDWPNALPEFRDRYNDLFSSCAAQATSLNLDPGFVKTFYIKKEKVSDQTSLTLRQDTKDSITPEQSKTCALQAIDSTVTIQAATQYWQTTFKEALVLRVRQKAVQEMASLPVSLVDKYVETYASCVMGVVTPRIKPQFMKSSYVIQKVVDTELSVEMRDGVTDFLTQEEVKACNGQAGLVVGAGGVKMLYDLFK